MYAFAQYILSGKIREDYRIARKLLEDLATFFHYVPAMYLL